MGWGCIRSEDMRWDIFYLLKRILSCGILMLQSIEIRSMGLRWASLTKPGSGHKPQFPHLSNGNNDNRTNPIIKLLCRWVNYAIPVSKCSTFPLLEALRWSLILTLAWHYIILHYFTSYLATWHTHLKVKRESLLFQLLGNVVNKEVATTPPTLLRMGEKTNIWK